MPSAPLFALRAHEVFPALETTPDGLTTAEAQERLNLYGPNRLRTIKPVSLNLSRLASQAAHPMALLLWGAGLIAILGGRHILGLVIWVVVAVNAVFSYWQEYRAEKAVSSLETLLPDYARVLRDSTEAHLPSAELVPGDVLVLAEGDNIPADARIVQEFGLRVNNSTLTGEAMPAKKNSEASVRDDLTEMERPNLIFAGTSIASGTARAVVYATGTMTQFGRIARLTREVAEQPSRLQEEMRKITRVFTVLALGIGAFAFGYGYLHEQITGLDSFILAIGVIVAVIPEGLVPTLTLSLAIAVQRLAHEGILVKSLSVMETLGTTSVICTDKSGTLTQNQMTVREVWVGGRKFRVTGEGYSPKGSFTPPANGSNEHGDLDFLLTAATLCNNSRLLPPSPEHPSWTYLGDQTEAALRVLAIKGGIPDDNIQVEFPRIHEIPFDARRKRMSTIHTRNGEELAFIKGAPREVLSLCTHIRKDGEDRALDSSTREAVLAANDEYAKKALRVLALAYRRLPERTGAGADYSPESVERELTFLGLTGMMDPPRPEVAASIQRCRQAGIRLVMITGDYGLTADSLARRIGMLATPNPRILTGAELEQLSDAQLKVAIKQETIFARMAPEHKLRLVSAFQELGEVVAVIGDGVNDAPALRKADIGIAMGITGTDVAREAADVVLTNDNFGAVAHAVEEGRTVFDNIRKVSTYIFASNIPEMIPLILTALLDIPMALTVVQILAIDMGTDLLPALALGSENPEPDVMERKPRSRTQPLIGRAVAARSIWLGLIEAVLCYSGFLFVYYRMDPLGWRDLLHPIWQPFRQLLGTAEGRTYILATTMFHAGVVMSQIGNVFACRTERERTRRIGFFSNRFLLLSIVVEVFLILSLIYIPPLAALFEHIPIPPALWGILVLYGPTLYILEKVRKSIIRRGFFQRSRGPLSADSKSSTGSA